MTTAEQSHAKSRCTRCQCESCTKATGRGANELKVTEEVPNEATLIKTYRIRRRRKRIQTLRVRRRRRRTNINALFPKSPGMLSIRRPYGVVSTIKTDSWDGRLTERASPLFRTSGVISTEFQTARLNLTFGEYMMGRAVVTVPKVICTAILLAQHWQYCALHRTMSRVVTGEIGWSQVAGNT